MALPIQTFAPDVVAVCRYLRTKPTGAPEKDVGAIVGSTFIDRRKLLGYESWGLIARNGGLLAVTPLGRQLGQAADDMAARPVFASVVASVGPYRKALEYIRSQGISQITSVDLGAWWHDHMPSEIGLDSDKSIVSAANSFFSIADAAGVGAFVLGRHGTSTRLDGIDIQRAAEILDGTLPVDIAQPPAAPDFDDLDADDSEDFVDDPKPPRSAPVTSVTGIERVFLAHGHDMTIVQQIVDIVRGAGMQPEIAEEEETTAIPVPDKVFDAMRRCQAAVICVTRDSDDAARVNENVLIEIGAAFVLYNKQVILVWDKSLPVPSNLQGLYRCELESNKLSWDEGMKLLRAINRFKDEGPA